MPKTEQNMELDLSAERRKRATTSPRWQFSEQTWEPGEGPELQETGNCLIVWNLAFSSQVFNHFLVAKVMYFLTYQYTNITRAKLET